MAARTRRSHDDYTVGWICALPIEMAAAKLMLDEVHEDLPVSSTDHNAYTLGSVKDHDVVMACLPGGDYGLVSANTVATQLLSSFRSIRFGLMVGIGGGVPSNIADIRLGDVVVSKPTGIYGGVVQYDYGKAMSGEFERTGILNRPPQILLTALSKLQSNHFTEGSRIADFLAEVEQKIPQQASTFARPTHEDQLFFSDYHHIDSRSMTCTACDTGQVVPRSPRDNNKPQIHYGLIASGNQLVRDSKLRDRLSDELGVFCVEMEAAGLSNNFPCLVIRGICDYADSHKNKEWQSYASIVAAAYAKELLLCASVLSIEQVKIAQDFLSNGSEFQVTFDLTGVPAIENFLGRHEELDDLWHHLQPENNNSRKVAVLHGLGGIGKTQLAIHFAREHKEHFTAIFWLAGRSRETLLQSLSSVLSRLPGQSDKPAVVNEGEVERNAKQVLRWLASPGNTRWLLIFDNIDQYSPGTDDGYDVGKFFPTADHGSILITSRLQSITELGRPFALQGLDFKDSISLLWQSRHLSDPDTATRQDPDTATRQDQDVIDLINRLGGLPLAITIAGSFMRETGTDFREYLRYYQESWHDLQSDAKPGRHYRQGNILQTWSVSYDEIRKRDPDMAKLLLLLAHFDNRDIWYELLESGKLYPDRPTWFTDVLSNSLVFKKRIRILIEFSLINVNEQKGSYMMHPVVQDWCLDVASMREKARNGRWTELALVSVGNMVTNIYEPKYWKLQQRLLIHADYVCRVWISDPLMSDTELLSTIWMIGMFYYSQTKWKEAEMIFQRALPAYEEALGPDDPLTLDRVRIIGRVLQVQKRWKEAEPILQRALSGFEKTLGPNNPSVLKIVLDLGIGYRTQGKWKEAETMFQRALAGFEEALGSDYTTTLNAIYNIGFSFQDQRRWEAILQRALSGLEKALGPDNPSVLDIVVCLGIACRKQGKWKEAETMFQRALAGFEEALGPGHTRTLNAVHQFAFLRIAQARWPEAETMLQRAIAGYEEALDPDHVWTLEAVKSIGLVYNVQGRWEEEEMMYQRVLAGYKRTLGPDHNFTLDTIKSMGELYEEQGDLDKAMMLYQEAWTGYGNTLGRDHDATLHVYRKIEEIIRGRLK
ncbi:hypothetical protein ZTR_01469 [Talaromyces verruculosus]|nr:hypothetical protein ZTR_01469 [Talaromyces verruculosus]